MMGQAIPLEITDKKNTPDSTQSPSLPDIRQDIADIVDGTHAMNILPANAEYFETHKGERNLLIYINRLALLTWHLAKGLREEEWDKADSHPR